MEQEKIILNEILNTIDKKDWNSVNLDEYIKHVVKLAKLYYNIPEFSYEISKLGEGDLGSCNNNKIEISEKLMHFKAIYTLTKTIFHEMRHVQQLSSIKLQIDGNYTATIPVVYCNSNINMLDCKKLSINPYDIYFTSYLEKDARDTSLKRCRALFEYLYKNVQNESSKYYIKIIVSLIKKDYEIETEKYAESLYKLIYDKREFNSIIKNWLKIELNQLESYSCTTNGSLSFKYWFFFLRFAAILTVYCDDEIKQMFNKFIVPKLKYVSVFRQYTYLHNFPFWNTTSDDLQRIFAMSKKHHISFSELDELFFNYDPSDITKRYMNFLQQSKNAKSHTSKIEIDNSNEFEK